jgi:hypothetical protein
MSAGSLIKKLEAIKETWERCPYGTQAVDECLSVVRQHEPELIDTPSIAEIIFESLPPDLPPSDASSICRRILIGVCAHLRSQNTATQVDSCPPGCDIKEPHGHGRAIVHKEVVQLSGSGAGGPGQYLVSDEEIVTAIIDAYNAARQNGDDAAVKLIRDRFDLRKRS